MANISIISSSVRTGRKSDRVALYFKNYIIENKLAETEILDLKDYNFPIFNERLSFQENPTARTVEFAEKIKSSSGIIIVAPEYNGSLPASLKNVIDLLYEEWHKKPIAIAAVSNGIFGGAQLIPALQIVLWKIYAQVISDTFQVPKVQDEFDELGNPYNKIETNKRTHIFIESLLYGIELNK